MSTDPMFDDHLLIEDVVEEAGDSNFTVPKRRNVQQNKRANADVRWKIEQILEQRQLERALSTLRD